MDFFSLLFGGGQSIQLMFKYGFIPTENDFLELTEDQYAQLYASGQGEKGERFFMLAPQRPDICLDEDYNEITVVSETEKRFFKDGAEIIAKYCEGHDFHTDEEKLRHVAGLLPDVFSKGSKYEKYHHLSVEKE